MTLCRWISGRGVRTPMSASHRALGAFVDPSAVSAASFDRVLADGTWRELLRRSRRRRRVTVRFVVFQDPLAYLLGVEGVALLKAFSGDFDQDFVDARIAEVHRLLDTPALKGIGVTASSLESVEGYRAWSSAYDDEENGLFGVEEPIVHEIIDRLEPGVALDAACGTGRHSKYLADHDHAVIGVDSSAEMLALARRKVPQADLRVGPLDELPVPDGQVDLVVCSLALTHVPDLDPVMSEFARALRPGGHLVISDVHRDLIELGSVPRVRSGKGEPGLLPAYRHLASDYLGPALAAGLELQRCSEPRQRLGPHPPRPAPEEISPGPWDEWPWSLHGNVPAAARAAFDGLPLLIVWHFRLPNG
jgi:SAM-dependent methyltransferase